MAERDYGRWSTNRPRTMVVACSDGRLQEATDAFLHTELGLAEFDRLYVPGGGGALSASDRDVFRAQQLRGECKYLVELHEVRQIMLLFHGPAAEGPAESVCADYRRKLPWATPDVLRQRQARDALELLQLRAEWAADANVAVYRCEVGTGKEITFRTLDAGARAGRDGVGRAVREAAMKLRTDEPDQRVPSQIRRSLVQLGRRQLVVADGGDLLGVAPGGLEDRELAFHGASLGLFVDRHLQGEPFGRREVHRAELAVAVEQRHDAAAAPAVARRCLARGSRSRRRHLRSGARRPGRVSCPRRIGSRRRSARRSRASPPFRRTRSTRVVRNGESTSGRRVR